MKSHKTAAENDSKPNFDGTDSRVTICVAGANISPKSQVGCGCRNSTLLTRHEKIACLLFTLGYLSEVAGEISRDRFR